MTKRYTQEQIIRILPETEATEVPINERCRKHGTSDQTFSNGETSTAAWTSDLESENSKLKRMLAEQLLVMDGLREFSREHIDDFDGTARRVVGSTSPHF